MDAVRVRTQNLASVMRLLFTGQAATRQDLSELSGLSRMTITNLTNELIARGIVAEDQPEQRPAGPGRVAMHLVPAANSPVVIGINLTKSTVTGVIADLTAKLLHRERLVFEAEETAETITRKVLDLASSLIDRTTRPILATGLAMPGLVDTEAGAIARITGFYAIETLPLGRALERHLGIPVVVHNGMRAAALAELHFGAGAGRGDFIFLGLSEGVGASIIRDPRSVYPAGLTSTEFGHMSVDFRGPQCACGSRGCVEIYAGAKRLRSDIQFATGQSFPSVEAALSACADDPRAGNVLSNVMDRLAVALNNVINLLDVFTVILGESYFHIPDRFVQTLQDELNAVSLFRGLHEISVVKSPFGDQTGSYAPVALVLDQLFTGRRPLGQE